VIRKLTPKQERFIVEYMKTSNASQAAINAGYSAVTAASSGPRLLNHPEVARRLALRVERSLTAADVSPNRVIEELARLALGDISQIYDETGNLKPLSEIDADVRRTISGIEVSKTRSGRGEDADEVHVTKVRTWDKVRALEILAKYLGLLVEKVEVSVSDDLAARLAAGRNRVQALQPPAIEAEVVREALPEAKAERSVR